MKWSAFWLLISVFGEVKPVSGKHHKHKHHKKKSGACDGNKTKPLYYLHIPKAGGNTFRDLLPKLLTSEQPTLDVCADLSFISHKCCEMPPGFCMYDTFPWTRIPGHLPYEKRDRDWHCGDVKLFRMAMLREPLSRIHSSYSHAASMKVKPSCCAMPLGSVTAIRTNNMTLDQYCDLPGSANGMTKQFSGRSVSDRHESDPALLTQALRSLHEFQFVGITEHYPESVELLKHKLGLPVRKVYKETVGEAVPKVNVHKHTGGGGCSDSRAQQRNALDIELYRNALELFTQQFCEVWPEHESLCGGRLQGRHQTSQTNDTKR